MKERFTLQLAAVDCIPVLLFSATAIVLAGKIGHPLFIIGAVLCVCAGLGKVIWKLILAMRERDIRVLGAQLRYVMPIGFLMIAGASQSETTSQLLRQTEKCRASCFLLQQELGLSSCLCAVKSLTGKIFEETGLKRSSTALYRRLSL